jgi:hypothetical protein
MPAIDTQFTNDENLLLSKVPEDGGAIGNVKLRNILAWDVPKYLQIKRSLLDKGVLQPGRGMGGSLKRVVASSTNPRLTNGRRGAKTDNSQQENQGAITRKQRAKLSKILFNSIPKNGKTTPNHAVLEKVQEVAKKQLKLDVSNGLYFEIRNELIAAGQIGKGVGYGGSVYRIEGTETASKTAIHHRIRERDLYEPIRKYIEKNWVAENDIKSFVLDKTAEQGSKKTRGVWTRPDFSLVAIHTYTYIPGKTIELITFEVKPAADFRIEGVFETAAHSRATHRSYLMIHTPNGGTDTDKFQRLMSECERFQLGLIIFDDPDNLETFKTVQDADHRNPNPGDVNSFIKTLMNKQAQEKISEMVH